jgi:mercuric ion binding protein
MKHIARLAFALLIALWSVTSARAEGASYRLEVDGLACPFCAYGVEKKLNALHGVERLETNIKEGAVIVTMKDGAELDEASARQAVKDAGFTLNGFKQESPGTGK